MRWAQSQRQNFIATQLRDVGHITRGDLTRAFDISTQQASSDFRYYLAENPGGMHYNSVMKRYEQGNAGSGHECRPEPEKTAKASYIGAPAVFKLEIACQLLREAFSHVDSFGIYQVGSSLDRADWRDVDLRIILSDEAFKHLFPHAGDHGAWEFDPLWLLLTVSISAWLKEQTGLPIDFQFQPQTWANERHKKPRNAKGMKMSRQL
jgi:hypothetical protein